MGFWGQGNPLEKVGFVNVPDWHENDCSFHFERVGSVRGDAGTADDYAGGQCHGDGVRGAAVCE